MRILVKRNNKLINLGEGKIYSKSQLNLNEGEIDATIPPSDSIQQAQIKAQKLINQNSNVVSASSDAGKLDGQSDKQTGEGLELKVPVNATGSQLAQAQKMTKDQSADDAKITFTKPQSSSNTTTESRIIKMRENSIPFTKRELTDFLNQI